MADLRLARPALALLALALSLATTATARADDPRVFGAPLTLDEPTPLARVLAEPEAHTEAPVLLKGRVADVCQKKGCWTVLQDGDATVRVRFRDYDFFVPRDIQGREVLVEGVVQIRTLSERDARHYARESMLEDAGAIEGPQREIGFVANGVELLPRS